MVAVEFVADKESRRFFDPQAQPYRIVASNGSAGSCAALWRNPIHVAAAVHYRNYVGEVVERYGRALHRAMPELRQLAG